MINLDELKIKKYCMINNYKYRCFGDNAIIMTNVDEWVIEALSNDRILVRHINKQRGRTKKMHFHSQQLAYDLDYAFKNIITPHETYNRVFQKAFVVKELLASK